MKTISPHEYWDSEIERSWFSRMWIMLRSFLVKPKKKSDEEIRRITNEQYQRMTESQRLQMEALADGKYTYIRRMPRIPESEESA